VVHEWGTDTSVVGSDGSLQRGLHHEEEDLPGFVYDRIKGGAFEGSPSVEIKMETPVTYFYSAKPLAAQVKVGFPRGILTQWYPAAQASSPPIVGPNSKLNVTEYADPTLDPAFPFDSSMCRDKYASIKDGVLDWGQIAVLAPTEVASVPDAPLDAYTW